MLQREYKRDMHKNYMILKGQSGQTRESYEMKMVVNNRISGLLEVEIRTVDQAKEYYYNITAKQPFSVLFGKESLKEEQIKKLLSEIIVTLKKGREYLLSEDSFVILPDYIYMNLDGSGTELVYFAGYKENIQGQLLRFIEYMMDKVDYEDKPAVFLIYGIYKISREEACTFEKLLEFLQEDKKLEKELLQKEKEEKELWQEEEKVAFMEMPVEYEEEKKRYPLWVWIGCIVSVLTALGVIVIAVQSGILFDVTTGRLLPEKIVMVFGITGALEVYALTRLLDEKNQVAYVVKKIDYIKPVEEKRVWENQKLKEKESHILFKDKENWKEKQNLKSEKEKRWEENTESEKDRTKFVQFSVVKAEDVEQQETEKMESEQATVVLAAREECCFLAPEQPDTYMPIFFPEFPFFVGTLKTKVDCVINNRSVSRFHAKFEKEEGKFFIADLNSTNGTFLNGIRLTANERKEIVSGDYVSFADVMYQFRVE